MSCQPWPRQELPSDRCLPLDSHQCSTPSTQHHEAARDSAIRLSVTLDGVGKKVVSTRPKFPDPTELAQVPGNRTLLTSHVAKRKSDRNLPSPSQAPKQERKFFEALQADLEDGTHHHCLFLCREVSVSD
jgi:hypothetical protein